MAKLLQTIALAAAVIAMPTITLADTIVKANIRGDSSKTSVVLVHDNDRYDDRYDNRYDNRYDSRHDDRRFDDRRFDNYSRFNRDIRIIPPRYLRYGERCGWGTLKINGRRGVRFENAFMCINRRGDWVVRD